jgi:hypothetical protein
MNTTSRWNSIPGNIALVLSLILLIGLSLGHAQETATAIQSAQPDSIVQITADAAGLQPMSLADLPRGGTFWVIVPGYGGGVTALPYPCMPGTSDNLPVYAITGNSFLVDDTGGQVLASGSPLATQTGRAMMTSVLETQANTVANLIAQIQGATVNTGSGMLVMDASSPMIPGGGGGTNSDGGFYSDSFNYTVPTNGLWLQITNVANGLAYLNLNNATDLVYEILSKTDLTLANWNIEGELFPGINTNTLPFTVQESGRTNLFIWAQDWTGITENGNTTPDWWFWKYFGTVELSDTNLDAGGIHTLLYDYTNGIVPIYSFHVTTPPLSQEVFDDDTVTFTVETGGNTNLTYQWTFNEGSIPGATNSSYTIYGTQASDAGNYAVLISDGTNSILTAAAQLTDEGGTGGSGFIMFITGPRQNYTFRSGVTYVISPYYFGSSVTLYGKTVIESGAVLKFDTDYSTNANLMVFGDLECQSQPYNPAILTCIDDDFTGDTLEGYGVSTGSPITAPSGTGPYLDLTYATNASIQNLRVCFADQGITTPLATGRLDLWDCQFLECNYGVVNLIPNATDGLHNVLFAGCGAAVGAASNSIAIEGEQITADVGDFFAGYAPASRISLTNSIIFGESSFPNLSTTHVIFNPDPTNFQSEGLANYYLAANSPLHNSGAVNISTRLQTELRSKSTYAPVEFPAFLQISGQMTLAPQAPRFNGGPPDCGYYYDALDYTVANLVLKGANLTVLPGTAIAVENQYVPGLGEFGSWTTIGFDVMQGGSVYSHATPDKPSIFTAEKQVQETPNVEFANFQQFLISQEFDALWFDAISFVPDYQDDGSGLSAPVLDFRFCQFYMPPNDYHVWAGGDDNFDLYYGDGQWEASYDSSVDLTAQDCAFYGGRINLGNPDIYSLPVTQVYPPGTVSLLNNAFDDTALNLEPTFYQYFGDTEELNIDFAFQAYNNLFRRSPVIHLEPVPASAGNWLFKDNLFDKTAFIQSVEGVSAPLDYGYNGYYPLAASELNSIKYRFGFGTNWLAATATGDGFVDGTGDVTLLQAPPYQTGPLGNYYLPDTTPLYGAGSDTPANLGLYHYTTQTNQFKEGSEVSGHMANIGVHYIATANASSTVPKDTDGDGIPDYVENWHGDGNYSLHTDTETDWQNPMTDGVTPDAYSPVYDDVDLDGDGLTGRAERFFGTNPLIPDNPLNLSTIPQGASLSGIVQIPLNISTNMDTNTVFHFFVDGLDVGTTISQGSNSWSVEWDTMTIPNGTHFISAGTTLDLTGHKAFGVSTVVAVNNAITVDETARWFTDQLTIDANVNVDASEYTIEVYDAETQEHLQTLTGDVSNGQIQTSWNLQDDEGNRIVDGPLICDFYLTSSGSSAQSRSFRASPNGNSSGSSSASVLFKFIPHVSGQSFTVAYGYDYSSSSKMNALQTMMLSSVVENLDTLYDGYADLGGGNDYNLLPTDSGGNVPYASAWQFQDNQSSINTLEGALGSGANFYWWGHCNTDVIAPTPSGVNFVSSGMVGQVLRNNADQGKIAHSYRLVILDGCEGYSKAWADAFGIVYQANGSSYTVDDYNNRFHLDPQAFVGWTVDTPAPSGWALSVDGIQEWQNALDVLFSEWQLGYPLNVCIKDYTDTLVSYGFTSDNGFLGFYGSGVAVKQYKISGCVDLTTFDR